jgi:hypothetical protein
MGEIFLVEQSIPALNVSAAWPAPVFTLNPVLELAEGEDPIECEPVKRYGCAFWRSDWHTCTTGHEARVTARELGHGGPGYCFFELRCADTNVRTARQGWYLNWRNFTPAQGMRLIADYRSNTRSRSQAAADHEVLA